MLSEVESNKRNQILLSKVKKQSLELLPDTYVQFCASLPFLIYNMFTYILGCCFINFLNFNISLIYKKRNGKS